MTDRLERISARVVGTWFGVGYFPFAPGTIGSLAALGLALLVRHSVHIHPLACLFWAIALTMPAMWAADTMAREDKNKDPRIVVVDEVVGQWITLAAAHRVNWKSCLIALALFRLFDILKPYPIRRLEALPGGVGIVADDILAGVYGALVFLLLGWFNLN